MMSKITLFSSILVLAAASQAAAQSCGCGSPNGGCGASGGGCNGGGCNNSVKYHDSTARNLYWPNQYVWPARRAICQIYATQANNGWQRNNMLGSYHFTENGQELSDAGRRKAQWILTQNPPERRTVYVERSTDQTQTAERVQAVQTLAANLNSGSAMAADVQETPLREESHPAAGVDAVFTGFKTNAKPPVLPDSGGGSSSSSSDSGS